jgi:hypothetical protein
MFPIGIPGSGKGLDQFSFDNIRARPLDKNFFAAVPLLIRSRAEVLKLFLLNAEEK